MAAENGLELPFAAAVEVGACCMLFCFVIDWIVLNSLLRRTGAPLLLYTKLPLRNVYWKFWVTFDLKLALICCGCVAPPPPIEFCCGLQVQGALFFSPLAFGWS